MGSVIRFVKKYYLLLAVQVAFVLVAVINRFPDGYIYAAHDFSYPLDLEKFLYSYGFLWNNFYLGLGEYALAYSAAPFYMLVYGLRVLFGLSDSSQSIIYYFLFFTASFWGMWACLALFDKHNTVPLSQRVLYSLSYTFNFYTFYVFYFQYGFTPFLYLYALFPVMVGLIYRFLVEDTKQGSLRYLGWIAIVSVASNITNSNTPFFFSANILIGVFIIAFLFTHRTDSKPGKYLKKIFAYGITYTLAVMWSVLPLVFELYRGYFVSVSNTSIYDLKDWMFSHALRFSDVLTMSPPFRWYYYYSPGLIYTICTFVLIGLFFLSFAVNKKVLRITATLSIVYIVAIILANKGKGVVDSDVAWQFFKNPLLASIRSYDKSLIYLPFFVYIIVFLNLVKKQSSKLTGFFVWIILICQLFISYPLWSGQVQTRYSFLLDRKKNETFENSAYSSIVNIPDEYEHAYALLNSDPTDHRILVMPFSAVIPGFADFPEWGVRAFDPTLQKLNNSTVQMNSYASDFLNWNYGEYWNVQNDVDSDWLVPFSSLSNVKYIIFHKDIDPEYINKASTKLSYYETSGLIKNIYSSNYIDVYEIIAYQTPGKIYVPARLYPAIGAKNQIPDFINAVKPAVPFALTTTDVEVLQPVDDYLSDGTSFVTYDQVSPVEYTINLKSNESLLPLVFSERFHYGWVLKDALGAEVSAHFVANGYSNGWIVNGQDCNTGCNFRLQFAPQRIYNISLALSASTLIAGLALISYSGRSNKIK